MEAGGSSSSLGASGASASSDTLNGLKFGKKIYFEDVGGVGGSGKGRSVTITGSSSSSPAKKGRGMIQGGQPPRCQVEGCRVDLSEAKTYYYRHKVCGLHSKSPKVIVNGLEQRFCQQCSRFHLLPEFDQGKRSCRRRLAGHNERRRKPPLGSLTSRYAQLPPSFSEDNMRVGGFLDFTYPRSAGRGVWPALRIGEQLSSNHSAASGKYHTHLWQGSMDIPSTNVLTTQGPHHYLPSSDGGASYTSSGIPTSESFARISDSGCALSLLSSQPWGPKNRASGVTANNFINNEGALMAQSNHGIIPNNFISNEWNFKNQETSSSSHEIPHKMEPGQVHEATVAYELAPQRSKQYMDHGQPRGYGSTSNQMHWSL